MKADNYQGHESDDCDRQDVEVEDSPEEYEQECEHSYQDISHLI